MKKFLFILLIIFAQIFFLSCGNIDFTVGSGSSLFSLMGVNLIVSKTAPGAPVNLQSTAIATDKIDLVWENNSSNARGFRIERSAGNNASFTEIASIFQGGATSYNDDKGLSPGTTYYYRIRAYNTAGNSDYSNITNTTTYNSTPLVPANPSILQATASSASQVTLLWHDNSDNETGFNVERRAEGDADYSEIASSLPADTTTYTASGLNSTTIYYFRVRAYNSYGNSGYSNEAIIIICPEAPGSVSATAVSSTRINISWADNSSNESGFRIERSTGNNSNFTEIVGDLPAGTTSYSNTGLTYNTAYYYRVRAYNAFGNSGYSNESSATTNDIIPYAPTDLTATAASSSQINLAWTDNSTNETGFSIERSGNNITFTQIATVGTDVTSYNNTGLSPNTTYYYRVRAYNGVGNSGSTNSSSAITDDIPPADPSGLVASAVSSSRIVLTWNDNSSNEAGFRIERSTPDNINYSIIVSNLPAGTTSYSNTGLNPSTIYYYRVRAYNSVENSGYSNEAYATTNSTPTTTQIIADHTIVDDYDKIPATYMAEVKKMWINIFGQSHSQAYRVGLTLLESQNSDYAVNVVESGNPDTATDQYLRSSRANRLWWNAWGYQQTESYFYTWYAYDVWPTMNDTVITHINYCNQDGYNLSVIGYGWCWNMGYHNPIGNPPGGTVDPVFNARWAGSSENGPDGSRIWGLDSGDYALTGNRVCMDTYLGAVDYYNNYCITNSIPTNIIFTTGPQDCGGELGYQVHLKNQYIRDYVNLDNSRILFDYADILAYDNNGSLSTTSWNGHTFPILTTTNTGDGSIGHIGSAGAIRLAKAQWWMLARIAGWDGN